MAQCPYTRIRRHNKVAFTVMQAMNAAGIIATRERQLPGTQHSADIWATNPLPTHPNDQYFLIDVTRALYVKHTHPEMTRGSRRQGQKAATSARDWANKRVTD